jgi:hypothetical protein
MHITVRPRSATILKHLHIIVCNLRQLWLISMLREKKKITVRQATYTPRPTNNKSLCARIRLPFPIQTNKSEVGNTHGSDTLWANPGLRGQGAVNPTHSATNRRRRRRRTRRSSSSRRKKKENLSRLFCTRLTRYLTFLQETCQC